MAAKRARSGGTQRVTQVDPWIVGGEGRLVDLFPFPPWVILLSRFFLSCLKHPIRTIIFLSTMYLVFFTDTTPNNHYDIHPFYLLFPLWVYLFIAILHISKHWYYSPDVSFIRFRRRNQDT